jgi:RNA polymerase sigma factor (TIGR02999 family)
MSEVSQILSAIEQGDPQAAEQLLALELPGQTLQATALVHEAYVRLTGPEGALHWNGRTHFFRAAADAMRRILVDKARQKRSHKRGGAWQQVDLEQAAAVVHDPSDDAVAVSEALDLLAAHDPVKAELVKLRFFAGLSVEEAADLLGISRATADRYWRYAKTWLYCALTRQSDSDEK